MNFRDIALKICKKSSKGKFKDDDIPFTLVCKDAKYSVWLFEKRLRELNDREKEIQGKTNLYNFFVYAISKAEECFGSASRRRGASFDRIFQVDENNNKIGRAHV